MALSKYRIGDLITPVDERNTIGLTRFYGVNINKEFMPTVASTDNLDERKYKIVRKGRFVYSGMQTGRDECIRISMFTGEEPVIVSPAYTTFEVTATDKVNPTFFFMIFQSKEKDRFGAFCSDGSIRANLDWEVFCDFVLELPSLPIQEKYVQIYTSMIANRDAYARGLQDLKLTCDAYIEDLRRRMPSKTIGPYIVRSSKNSGQKYNRVLGIGQKGFISPQKQPNESLANYKIVKKYDIVYAPPMYNIKSDAIEISREEEPFVCSPIYEVFSCTGPLLAEYLLVWLKRDEFKRYAEFYALGIRNTFDFELMAEVQIPIPDEKTQRAIAALYEIYYKRKRIFEDLKARAVNLCQILIRGAIKEGAQA